jgi:hypothetical protein
MKHALPMQVLKAPPSSRARSHPDVWEPAKDSERIQGGNWSMQGLRRSVHVFDEDECQVTINEFMGAHARFESFE